MLLLKNRSVYTLLCRRRKRSFYSGSMTFFKQRLQSKMQEYTDVPAIKNDVARIRSESETLIQALNQPSISFTTSSDTRKSKQSVDTIKNQVHRRQLENIDIKREHDMRRDILIQERRRLQEQLAKQTSENYISNYIQKKSLEEQNFQQHMQDVYREKEVMVRNRIVAQREYESRRDVEYQESLKMDSNLRDIYPLQSQKLEGYIQYQLADAEKAYRLQKHKKHFEFCQNLSRQLVEVAIEVSSIKAVNGGIMPNSKMSELKMMLMRALPILEKDYRTLPLSGAISQNDDSAPKIAVDKLLPPVEDISRRNEELEQYELTCYIEGTEIWSLDSRSYVESAEMDEILESLKYHATSMSAKNTFPELSPSKLALAIIGKPCSGKSWLARQLADSCKAIILDPVDLVSRYLADSELLSDPAKAELISKLKSATSSGSQIDESLLNNILALEIKKSLDGNGFILVDYPKTRIQASLLEKELTGYEEPKNAKAGKKAAPAAKAPAAKKRPGSAADPVVPSYLDAVLYLEIETTVANARMAHRMLDPITNRIYNMEGDIPGEDEPGVMQRLVTIEHPNASNLQLRNLSFDENIEPLKEWFGRFGNWQQIFVEADRDEIVRRVRDIVSTIISKKSATLQFDASKERLNESAKIVDKKAAESLFNQWEVVDKNYGSSVKAALHKIRREGDIMVLFAHAIKEAFKSLVDRPDRKQTLVDAFRSEFNNLEAKAFTDNNAKAKLVVKVEDLREKLFDICDSRRDQSENERVNIMSSKWFESRLLAIGDAYCEIAQQECELFSVKAFTIKLGKKLLEDGKIDAASDFKRLELQRKPEKLEMPLFDESVKMRQPSSAPLNPKARRGSVTGSAKKESTSKSGKKSVAEPEKVQETPEAHALRKLVLIPIDDMLNACSGLLDSQNPEVVNLSLRISKIKEAAAEHIKSIKLAGVDILSHLDEIIGNQFREEIEAARAYIQLVNESIESKAKLPL
eukprot:Partr_v1_DN28912_c1_g1_i1_m26111 putative sperm flagellar 2